MDGAGPSGNGGAPPPGKGAPDNSDDDINNPAVRNVFGGERSDAYMLLFLLLFAVFAELCNRTFVYHC